MAWDDRPHYRDRSGASTNPLVWLVSGSVPLVKIFGVRFRAHSSLIVFIVGMMILNWSSLRFPVNALSMALWIAILVVHEMAHCISARRMGGHADEALLWPMGGLTAPETPHRAGAQFAATLAGPGINFFLTVGAAFGVYAFTPITSMHGLGSHIMIPLDPLHGSLFPDAKWGWADPAFYFWWVFAINYRMLLLNLLPIHPLDGGRLLQSVLWPMLGHFRSMMIETTVGMAASIAIGLVSLATGYWSMAACMMFCFYQSYHRRVLLNEGADEDWRESFDFGSSLFADEKPRRKRLSRRVIRKARRIAMQEKAVRDRIDAILAKVSSQGMTSLTWIERRNLRKATQRHRRSETEISKFQ
jgi:stage IV sporulation protein FB